jgi:hypothetical protein
LGPKFNPANISGYTVLHVVYAKFYDIHVEKLTDGDASPDDLLDVKERAKGVEELEHHHCTTKLLWRNNTLHCSRLWEGLCMMSEERGGGGREREGEGK